MKHLILSAVLATSPAIAEPMVFVANQICDTPEAIFEFVMPYEEEPLFMGTGYVTNNNGDEYSGNTMFLVNQDSGTWTLLNFYDNNTMACIIASGYEFSPVTKSNPISYKQ